VPHPRRPPRRACADMASAAARTRWKGSSGAEVQLEPRRADPVRVSAPAVRAQQEVRSSLTEGERHRLPFGQLHHAPQDEEQPVPQLTFRGDVQRVDASSEHTQRRHDCDLDVAREAPCKVRSTRGSFTLRSGLWRHGDTRSVAPAIATSTTDPAAHPRRSRAPAATRRPCASWTPRGRGISGAWHDAPARAIERRHPGAPKGALGASPEWPCDVAMPPRSASPSSASGAGAWAVARPPVPPRGASCSAVPPRPSVGRWPGMVAGSSAVDHSSLALHDHITSRAFCSMGTDGRRVVVSCMALPPVG